MILNPLVKWACRIYQPNVDGRQVNGLKTESDIVVESMRSAFNTHFDKTAMQDNPWKHVKGPTTAMIATLLRLKWFPADYDMWIADASEVIDLKTMIPHQDHQKSCKQWKEGCGRKQP